MSSIHAVAICRTLLAAGLLLVGTLLFGPFQGAEAVFYLTDKQAHVLAFFALTTLSLAAAPRIRRGDLALVIVALAGATEIAQACVGRDGNVADMAADSIGVLLAWAPTHVTAIRASARNQFRPVERRRRSGLRPAGSILSPAAGGR
jgi:VanZ family protein